MSHVHRRPAFMIRDSSPPLAMLRRLIEIGHGEMEGQRILPKELVGTPRESETFCRFTRREYGVSAAARRGVW